MSGTVFDSFVPQKGTVNAADHQITIVGKITTRIERSIMPIALTHDLHVSELNGTNWISWRRLAENGFLMKGSGKEIQIIKDGTVQGKAILNTVNRVYMLEQEALATILQFSDASLWHERLGHFPSDSFRKI